MWSREKELLVGRKVPHSSWVEELQVARALLLSSGRKVPHSSWAEELLVARALLSAPHQLRHARCAENISNRNSNFTPTEKSINHGVARSVEKLLLGQ